MKPIHIVYLVFIIILILSIIINVVVIGIAIGLNNKIVILKNEKNYIQQNLEKTKEEIIERDKILEKQKELLDKVKNAKTYKDYLNIWKELAK